MKALIQFMVVAGLFLGLWFGLSKVNWIERFHIRQFTEKKQKQLGDWIIKMQRTEKNEVTDKQKLAAINKIVSRIAVANKLDTGDLHIFIFRDEMINAFALPGGNIIVNTALIDACDNPDMLAGVLAHEIAHVAYGHVNSKLAREIGLSTLAAASGDNLGILKQILKTLASTKFDREQEAQADRIAVRYLKKSNIDPSQFGYFMNYISTADDDQPKAMEWISTHPNAAERAKKIIGETTSGRKYEPSLDNESWRILQGRSATEVN